MITTDQQVRRFRIEMERTNRIGIAADRAKICENTARKYHRAGLLPSQMKAPRDWRTRADPFAAVWGEIEARLRDEPRLQAKTLFEEMQRLYPGVFSDGQERTLQRRVKAWRIEKGPKREVMFERVHRPGELSASDFTHMDTLGVKIAGVAFPHLLYHFVLTYSNWETGSICFSESFESLTEGFQRAVYELGGVPRGHVTDRLTAAVKNLKRSRDSAKSEPSAEEAEGPSATSPVKDRAEFQAAYRDFLAHFGIEGRFIRAGRANENGDVEQRHFRTKETVDQALMLRGSRDFADREAYEAFLREVFDLENAGRRERFAEERARLRPLPANAYPTWRDRTVCVSKFSTVRVLSNVYSVDSRLIGERLTARLRAETIELWHGQRCAHTVPRLIGKGNARIDYRHVIESLVRKPGAFANYRHREELFPSLSFRLAYDRLKRESEPRADRIYLRLLELAAMEGEERVATALEIQHGEIAPPTVERTVTLLSTPLPTIDPTVVTVVPVDPAIYDVLLSKRGAA